MVFFKPRYASLPICRAPWPPELTAQTFAATYGVNVRIYDPAPMDEDQSPEVLPRVIAMCCPRMMMIDGSFEVNPNDRIMPYYSSQ